MYLFLNISLFILKQKIFWGCFWPTSLMYVSLLMRFSPSPLKTLSLSRSLRLVLFLFSFFLYSSFYLFFLFYLNLRSQIYSFFTTISTYAPNILHLYPSTLRLEVTTSACALHVPPKRTCVARATVPIAMVLATRHIYDFLSISFLDLHI